MKDAKGREWHFVWISPPDAALLRMLHEIARHPGPLRWAAPDRTAPGEVTHSFSTARQIHKTNRKDPSQMREMSKGEGTPVGSNPTGVALPTTGNQDPSTVGALNSSVPTHTPGAFGPPVGATLATCAYCGRVHGTSDVCRACGRNAAHRGDDRCAPCGGVFHPERPEQELPPDPVRHCMVPVGNFEAADHPETCGAILGAELRRCDCCGGRKCYAHCGSVRHFDHTEVNRCGGARWDMIVVKFDHSDLYVGELREIDGSTGAMRVRWTTTPYESSDEAAKRLFGEMDAIHERERIPQRDAAVLALRFGAEAAADVAQPDDDVARALSHLLAGVELSDRARRARVSEALRNWLEETAEAWDDLSAAVDMNPRMVERCRELRDGQIADLFARLGGVL